MFEFDDRCAADVCSRRSRCRLLARSHYSDRVADDVEVSIYECRLETVDGHCVCRTVAPVVAPDVAPAAAPAVAPVVNVDRDALISKEVSTEHVGCATSATMKVQRNLRKPRSRGVVFVP